MRTLDNAFALVVGIADYQKITKLPSCVIHDALDVHSTLIDASVGAYPESNVQLLLDQTATLAALQAALARIAQTSDADSTIFIYISSHGGRIDAGPRAGEYLLPVDVDGASAEALASTAISSAQFSHALSAIQARKIVVIFDCCHSGGIGQPKDVAGPIFKSGFSEEYLQKLSTGRGRVILASSRSDEYSYVLPGATNSLFTQHLLAGLRGAAPGPGGVVRIFDLFHYLQPKVTADHSAQHPVFKAELEENFPVAMYLGGKSAAAIASALPSDGFAYDVFVSYRQQEPDRSWVRKVLVPRLDKEGLRVCIDFRSFRLGAPLVTEMARAVEESRYTLSILTPRYLESNFTELENILAEHLGLEKSQRRLLAILRETCTPRLGMRARLWLDMSDDGGFETDVERLVYELRQPPDK
jgi:hypothetical protein